VVAQNWQDLDAEEGNSSFDVRHSVSGNYVYELPFGKDKQWLTAAGPHISSRDSLSPGVTPLRPERHSRRVTRRIAPMWRGHGGSLRPNRDFSQSISARGGSQKEWFNTRPSPRPQRTPLGIPTQRSRNSIPGPGKVSNDMSLSKTVSLGDARSMEFRATADNVFNTVQYSGVDTSKDSQTFGEVTSVGTMRAFSFTARFRF